MMTRRERVLSALHFEKSDIVPYHVDFTYPMREKMIRHTGNPHFEDAIQRHLHIGHVVKSGDMVKPGFYRDEFGAVWNRSGPDKDIGVVDNLLLPDPEDLDSFAFPEVDEAFIRGEIERMLQTADDRFTVVDIGFSLFERAWILRGMENLLCDMIIEPEFVHALLDRITRRNLKILDIALAYDVDAVLFGDDWGQQRGMIMGPAHWRTFLKPCLAQMYGRVHKAGKYVIQHSCGDVREVMDDLHEIGLNMYNTFQPEIYGYDYARKIHGKIAIWGGVSTQRDLPGKTPDEIRRVTRELMAAFPQGGLVASPTHSVPGDVPPENLLAMLDVLEHQ